MELPRPLSHSSLTLYAECPQKYKFKYVDKIPEKPRHFFSFGSSVHQALEFFYGAATLIPPTVEELLAHYKEKWISAGYKDQAQEAQYFEDGKVILTRFHEKHARDFQPPLFVEYSFDLKIHGVPVTGKVDRVDKLSDGRLSVLDYKTGKALAAGRVQADGQLTMYQLACETLLGAEVARLSFYHLPTLKEQVVERHSSELVDGLKSRIVATAEAIVAERFEPKPDEKKCFWCDYKPLCPVFRKEAAPPPPPVADEELSVLVDRYGELLSAAEAAREEIETAKAGLLEALAARGFVRAFGRRYGVSRSVSTRWEFSDKRKVLDILKKAGLYESVLAPSAPKIEQLMLDFGVDPNVKARLQELGERIEAADLKVQPL